MSRSIAGRVVVITGASSGIARASALSFAREGAIVVLAARRGGVLDDVAEQCLSLGAPAALPFATDVADPDAVERLAEAAIQEFGRIDVWVNCAAVLHFGRIEDTPPAVIERTIATNVLGYFYGAQAAIRQFRHQGSGALINVASVLGVAAQPYAAAYVASKFAIRGLSESLRQELRGEPHIHVSTVLPFAIDTPIYQRAANYSGRGVRPIPIRYPAQTVADTILSVARRPRRNAYGGRLAQLAAWQKRLMPAGSERFVAGAVELSEFTDDPQSHSDGNLFEPSRDGYEISGGWAHLPGGDASLVLGGLAVAGLSLGAVLAFRQRQSAALPRSQS